MLSRAHSTLRTLIAHTVRHICTDADRSVADILGEDVGTFGEKAPARSRSGAISVCVYRTQSASRRESGRSIMGSPSDDQPTLWGTIVNVASPCVQPGSGIHA